MDNHNRTKLKRLRFRPQTVSDLQMEVLVHPCQNSKVEETKIWSASCPIDSISAKWMWRHQLVSFSYHFNFRIFCEFRWKCCPKSTARSFFNVGSQKCCKFHCCFSQKVIFSVFELNRHKLSFWSDLCKILNYSQGSQWVFPVQPGRSKQCRRLQRVRC